MTDSSPSASSSGMNRYGTLAWAHWERHRPTAMRSIPDPESYFQALGDLVEAEVTAETSTRLTATEAADPVRAAQVRAAVEEEILAAHVLLPDHTEPEPNQDPDLVETLEIPLDSRHLDRWRRSPLLDQPTGDQTPPV